MKTALHRICAMAVCVGLLAGIVSPAIAQTPAASPVASPVAVVEPTWEDDACMYDVPAGLTEGEDIFCGWVTAPMYPGEPRAETVKLPVVRFAATTDTPAEDPLVILLGGPGQDMSAVLPLFGEEAPLWRYMLERQDVIVFDQRGMGLSEPSLICPIEREAASGEVSNMALGIGLMNCGKQLQAQGVDLTAFNTTNNAADIDAIRIAMGYDQVNLYGISYGSKLALSAIRDYPDSIRSTIIASPLPLEDNVFSTQTIGFDNALQILWDACAADAECAAANPDPAAALERTLAQLKANPVPVRVANPATGSSMDLPIDDIQFMQIMYSGVFIGPFAPALPYLVTQTAAGDYTLLETMTSMMMVESGVSLGVILTYFCQEEVPFSPQSETNAELAEAGLSDAVGSPSWIGLGTTLYPVCDFWKLDPSDPIENEPVASDEPLLIFTGTLDPITPADNGEQIAANFPNSQVVEFTNQGHDPASMAFGCSEAMVLGYLNDPTAEVDATCADQPIDFSTVDWLVDPSATPEASPIASPAGDPVIGN